LYHIMYDKVVSLNVPYYSGNTSIPATGILAAGSVIGCAGGPTVHNLHWRKKMNHKVTYASGFTGEAVPIDGEIVVLIMHNAFDGATNNPGAECMCTMTYEV